MTTTVYYAPKDILLNLTAPDLGIADREALSDVRRAVDRDGEYQPGVFLCVKDQDDDHRCTGDMVIFRRFGHLYARHYNPGVAFEACNETDEHKALKQRIADDAERHGLHAEVEDTGAGRRTDVVVKGPDAITLGCEVQYLRLGAPAAENRTRIAQADGLTPMWVVTDPRADLIDHVPWTRVNDLPWHLIRGGAPIRAVGGLKKLETERCGDGQLLCPKERRAPCPGWHMQWITTSLPLDEAVVRAASGSLLAARMQGRLTSGRLTTYTAWITPEHRDKFLECGGVLLDEEQRPVKPPETVRPRVELPLDLTCHYLEDTGYRSAPKAVRDTGEAIEVELGAPTAQPVPGYNPPRITPEWWRRCRHRRCDATEEVRRFIVGPRCPQHTPARMAGEPEPGEMIRRPDAKSGEVGAP